MTKNDNFCKNFHNYDAWGKCRVYTSNWVDITENSGYNNHIGRINPFRYKGYYYDEGTGLYYLQSRYYDPETGRFITIDDVSYLAPDIIDGLKLYRSMPPALEGIIIAKANGVVSGATFHQPSIFSVVFSDATELAGCVLQKVKKYLEEI